MKKLTTFLFCLSMAMTTTAQTVIGAWEAYHSSESGESLRSVVIFADGYQVISTFQAQTGKFVHTNGGTWQLDGNMMTEMVEFHTDDTTRIGQSVSFEIELTDSTLSIVGSQMVLKRIDAGAPGALQGAWLMSGRKRDGQIRQRDINRPRKTMKMLSGTRFQWIAYNTATKQFMGTGGGTYTTINGVYTENIEFFSRDDNKAGISLKFDYQLKEGKWHHSGLSSKGSPIYEIWSVRE